MSAAAAVAHKIVSQSTRSFAPSGWLCTFVLGNADADPKQSRAPVVRVNQSSEGQWTCTACLFRSDCKHIQSVRKQTNCPDELEKSLVPMIL